jgi:TolB-like protein/DNA-binding winged helix-turn-helix (wHTH) protein/Flp pilus assembly protein TadD
MTPLNSERYEAMSEQINKSSRDQSPPEGHDDRSFERFQIADWTVDPASNQVIRGEQSARLEPKVMEVLVYLAHRPGEVVTREELEAAVWAGTIVGYDSVTSAIQKLRKALDDKPRQPCIIETLSKRGYRLVASVSPADTQFRDQVQTVHPAPSRHQWLPGSLLSLLALLTATVAALWWANQRETTDDTVLVESAPRSIAVLPFENIGNDSDQEYFADGITEDIITDLSRLSDLTVVTRDMALSYKGDEVLAQDVANDLGVRYVLQGSLRKSGDRLRITAQLIDTANGNHIWAERYDRKLVEIFALQDEVTQSIVTALAVKLTTEEKRQLIQPVTHNFEAYDLFLQGQQHFKQRTAEANGLARAAYKRAIDLDPTFARAYGAFAVALTVDFRQGWTEAPIETLEQALVLAHKAVALDNTSPQAYWALSFIYLYRKQFNEAVGAVEQAIELMPNYADGYGLMAFISNFRGESEEAITYIRRGIELNPYYTYEYTFSLGRSYYDSGRYPEAIDALGEVVERNANASFPRLYLAASYIRQGLQEEAEWEIEEVQVINPNTTLSHINNTLPFENQAQLETFMKDLRQAGLPE